MIEWFAPALGIPEVLESGVADGSAGRCLVWRLSSTMRSISSSIVGGGLDRVGWVINLTVDSDYGRMDPTAHRVEVAGKVGLRGPGLGMMTAVDVSSWVGATDDGAVVHATVGVRRPVWAADRLRNLAPSPEAVGTINLVAALPARLTDAALVNAVATITEAKVQALLDHRVPGTGTASDAVCVLCPPDGREDPFGGPRSLWGGRLAQAAYDAVTAGLLRQRASDH